MKLTSTFGAIGLLTTIGCGGASRSSLPPARVTEAQSAISAAEAVGASNNPRAALHLKHARDQVGGAKKLLQRGDADAAKLMLDNARADADLAMVLTRGQEQRAEAIRVIEQVRNLEGGQ